MWKRSVVTGLTYLLTGVILILAVAGSIGLYVWLSNTVDTGIQKLLDRCLPQDGKSKSSRNGEHDKK